MKRFILLFVFFLLVTSLVSQTRRDRPPNNGDKPIYVEAHLIPSDTLNICYVSYRVPFSNLVFIKDGLSYSSGIVFRVEVTGQTGVLTREYTHDKVQVNTYDETSRTDLFLEGMLSFELSANEATINPLVSLDNTQSQVPLRPFRIEKNFLQPIVAKKTTICEKSIGFKLVNFENSIPFDDINYQMIIPVFGENIKNVRVELKQKNTNLLSVELKRELFAQFDLQKCNSNIVLAENLFNNTTSIFVMDNFSNLLNEGPVEIKIIDDNDSTLYDGELLVNWIGKPFSLMNPKIAFELLEIMENEDVLDKIYKEFGGDYEIVIDKFWERFDPNIVTRYNQLKAEFYSRADYAFKQYSLTGTKGNAVSDRGKVYIKYGEPSEVDRYYSDKNQITEVWKYMSPKTQFVFIDVTGLGNYKLVD